MKKFIIAASVTAVCLAAAYMIGVGLLRKHTRVPEDIYNSVAGQLTCDYTAESDLLTAVTPEEISSHNTAALEHSITIPKDAVSLYVCADGEAERVRKTLLQVKELSDEICNGLSDDREKLRAISVWVSENLYYDCDACANGVMLDNISLENVLDTRRTVCLGFSNMLAALCTAQNIDCRVVRGTAVVIGTFSDDVEAELHEWNVAVIDGKTVWLDALWETGNSYFKGQYIDGKQNDKYFDADDLVLAKNHRADRIEIRDYFSLLE